MSSSDREVLKKLASDLNAREISKNFRNVGKLGFVFAATCAVTIIIVAALKESPVNSSLNINDSFNTNISDNSVINHIYQEKEFRPFDDLPVSKKSIYKAQMLVLFPELFSKKYGSKYDRAKHWLRYEKHLYHHHLKSLFTSIGRERVIIGDYDYGVLPGIFATLDKYHLEVFTYIRDVEDFTLKHYWAVNEIPNDIEGRLAMWGELVDKQAEKILEPYSITVSELVEAYIQEHYMRGTILMK